MKENMSAGAPALDELHQGDPGAQRFVVTYPVGRMYDRFCSGVCQGASERHLPYQRENV